MNRVTRLATGLLLAGSLIAMVPATAEAATGTSNVSVSLTSRQANPGDVEVTNGTGTTVYGTCPGLTTPGTSTCTYPVSPGSGVLLVLQPSTGERLSSWSSSCTGSPGPVCHVQSGAVGSTKSVSVHASRALAGTPALTTSQPYMGGSGPNCNPNLSVTVSGSGYPANSAVSLSDDGNVVASGTTDGSGNAQLTDGPSASEPGIYRTLSMSAGAESASTDVYNSGFFCFYQTPPAPTQGSVSMTVNASGADANSSSTFVKFANQMPVVLTADSTGAGTVTTPSYSCKVGKTYPVQIYGTRGAGTKQQYNFKVSVSATC